VSENPLKSEETFTKFVNGLCCNGCKFFVKDKCTEKDAKLHDEDKAWTVQAELNEYLHNKNEEQRKGNMEFIENINNYYLCLAFESRQQ
jgi:hypothetical protein